MNTEQQQTQSAPPEPLPSVTDEDLGFVISGSIRIVDPDTGAVLAHIRGD